MSQIAKEIMTAHGPHTLMDKPCRNGHVGMRDASGQCITCRQERNRERLQSADPQGPSRMLDIDHILEDKYIRSLAKDKFLDEYYHMEF